MDNSTQADDTKNGTMYLSFDSTISSNAAFRTMETISDISLVSSIDRELEVGSEQSQDSNTNNSTLEAKDIDIIYLNYNDKSMHTVKKVNVAASNYASPLRPFTKNIMKEFKAVCSTPSKEEAMRSVEFERGSDVSLCPGLKLGFLEAEGEKSSPSIFSRYLESNKENAIPEADEMSTLSASTGIAELTDSVNESKTKSTTCSPNKLNQEKVKYTRDAKDKSIQKVQILEEKLFDKKVAFEDSGAANKMNLKTDTQADNKIDDVSVIMPELIDKMLKITNAGAFKKDDITSKPKNKLEMNKPIPNIRGRVSQMPVQKTEKRPYDLTKRMSVVVKTTLNSPARKMARKTMLSNAQMRRSMLPTRNTAGTSTGRKSMLPVSMPKKSSSSNINVLNENQNQEKPKLVTRKTMYQPKSEIANLTEKQKPPIINKTSPSKPKTKQTKTEVTYTCVVCSAKFRIKSLLDAHKRSHEEGTSTFIKKQVAAAGNASEYDNKCKFCDKKFVLQRTLHIHLLQNCSKIPPSEKRKLEYTEMDHVEKAQLPTFVHANTTNSSAINYSNKKQAENMYNRSVSNSSTVTKSSSESLCEILESKAKTNLKMLPPQASSVGKMRKKTAHAGVYRTPNKSVPCHICKQTFKSILEYTDHNLKIHSAKKIPEPSLDKDETPDME